MGNLLLTDKEIGEIIRKSLGDELSELGDYDWTVGQEERDIAKAQAKKVVSEILRIEAQYRHSDFRADRHFRGSIVQEMQSLLKEIE